MIEKAPHPREPFFKMNIRNNEILLGGSFICFKQGKNRHKLKFEDIDLIAPAFIDVHSHSDYFLFLNPKAEAKLQQGVGVEIGGNCGYSAAPIWGKAFEKRFKEYKEYENLDVPWKSLSEYYEHIKSLKPSINYAHLVGHNTLRESETGVVNRSLSKEELKNITKKLEEAFEQGAVGLSTGLIYPPACFAPEEEVIALGKICKKYDRTFSFHMRSESDQVVEAVEETLRVGKYTGCKIQISHLKTSGPRNWSKLEKIFHLIEEAQSQGVDVMCDRYPYTASQTGLLQILPAWAYEGGDLAVIKRLKDSKVRSDIRAELEALYEKDYYERVQIMEVASQKNKKLEGKRVAQAAKEVGKDPFDFVCDLLIEEKIKVQAIYFTMSEKNLEEILKKPYVMIGSDSGCRSIEGRLSRGALHPRAFGTFPRVISEFVKKRKILTLEDAINKMTKMPAQRFGLKKRGEIKEGYYADLVVFDLNEICDTSTFEEPLHYPKGIKYVFINGDMVIKDGKHTGSHPGMVIKV